MCKLTSTRQSTDVSFFYLCSCLSTQFLYRTAIKATFNVKDNIKDIIKNSITLTFFDDYGNYNIENWLNSFQKYVKSKDQKFVLVCAHANRTKSIGDFLIDQGYTNVYHLYGGIAFWLNKNKETLAYTK